MNRYRLVYTQSAITELHDVHQFIHADSPHNAATWRAKLVSAAETLRSSPRRCALAPESSFSSDEARQLIFGNYRVVFTIDDDCIVILHIRHTARATMTADELRPPDAN